MFFSCINICRVLRKLFEHKAARLSFKHLWRDLATVNAMKQTCDRCSCILPDSSLKLHRKRQKVIKIIVFRKLNLVVQNGVSWHIRMSKMSFPLTTSTSTKV